MKSLYFLLSAAVLAASISCKSKKNMQAQSNSDSSGPSIALDTVVVKPQSEEDEKTSYKAANPRSNDILHTKLEVKFDWPNAWMFGKATLDIKPYFYSVNKLFLNARGMDIYKIQILKDKVYTDLKYVNENDSLKITLDKEYTKNDKYTIFIDYKAKPNELKSGGSRAITSDKGLYFINNKGEEKNKMPQIWTQGETQGNSAWMPTIDSPNEKMTNEIYITVEDKYTTLSNGDLISQTKNADGTRTDYWKMDQPHSPYLIMMGIGEFKVVKDKKWNGKEINYYVEKEYEAHAKAIFGNTYEMIEFYSNRLGVPYPWSKYSQIVARDYVSGAMENTSATLHGDFVYQTDRELLDGSRGEDVISHELFHQWFGDLVTAESWSNLPLNESFATYGEYLWEEFKYGIDAADHHSYGSRVGYIAESSQKQEPLIRFYYDFREDMFDGHSYNKGGQVLHMLRKELGDEAFFTGLKLYLDKNRFKNAEIHDLRIAMEEISGQDLNWFFNQWFMSPGHPVLDINYSYDETKKIAKVSVSQKQNLETTPLFRLPVYVDLYFGDGGSMKKVREKIVITKANQTFSFPVDSKPALINFDGEKQLLCEKTENKSIENYVYQYKNAPKFLDRLEALQGMKSEMENPIVYEATKGALKDNWHDNRIMAIKMLQEGADKHLDELKSLMVELAKNDKKTKVRAEALDFLSKNYKDDELKAIYISCLNEKSYLIMGAGLSALNHVDSKAAVLKAKELETEENDNIRFTVMDIYANSGDDIYHAYFASQRSKFSGFDAIGYITIYGAYLKRCKLESSIVEGASVFADIAKSSGGNVYVKYYAQKSVKDLLTHAQDLEDELTSKIESTKKSGGDVTALQAEVDMIIHEKGKLKEIYDTVK